MTPCVLPPSALPASLGTEVLGAGLPYVRGDTFAAAETLPTLHLLVVDDDTAVRNACCEIAGRMGFAAVPAESLDAARLILKHRKVDLVLLDVKLPGDGGLNLLEEVKALYPETLVIVMTACASIASAVAAMRVGAGDYLTKPFALEELVSILERAGERRSFDLESRRLREKLRTQKGTGLLIGRSPEMEKLYRILSKVANSDHPVLIFGEAGTGKELVARSIHFNGPHLQKPFVAVDCGSLMPELIEGELFGYVKGASPGVARSKAGLLSTPGGGTVFLDEIGGLTLDLQGKVLRAMQEKLVRPVGGTHALPLSTRILAATNCNLSAMVEQGRFRRDLYLRLSVVTLRIPPLRERKEDIPALAQHCLERLERERGMACSLSDDSLRLMLSYDWPGNVRELELAIERACALSSGPVIYMGDLPTQLQDYARQGTAGEHALEDATVAGLQLGGLVPDKIVSIAELEREAILGTVRQLKGDKLTAARLLGIGKTTLYRKLKEYGINEPMQGTEEQISGNKA